MDCYEWGSIEEKSNVWKVLKTVVESTFKDAHNLVKKIREKCPNTEFF